MLRRIIQEVNAYFPSLPLLARVYEISSAARIGFYDCVYLSLAEQQGCKMITSDLKLRIFPQVVLLSDFP